MKPQKYDVAKNLNRRDFRRRCGMMAATLMLCAVALALVYRGLSK